MSKKFILIFGGLVLIMLAHSTNCILVLTEKNLWKNAGILGKSYAQKHKMQKEEQKQDAG